jgi:4-amino-4-deoxy-L-arabinose transferase-like glycosyltransferase
MAFFTIAGGGFCLGASCPRPPLYIGFLALSTLGSRNYLLIVVPEALMGAGTALCAFLIGREIFSARAGLIACAIAALYPYYVVHNTALQDTAMATFCTALAVWLLLHARRRNWPCDWLLAGLALAAIALVRASLAPVIGVALLWTLI